MLPLVHTEFAALLLRADVSQAGFARLAGVTARQVNNWCRGRARVPAWAVLLAGVLQDRSAAELQTRLKDTDFRWNEVLGVSPGAGLEAARTAMAGLARRYHPDLGGTGEQRTRVNEAYEKARKALAVS